HDVWYHDEDAIYSGTDWVTPRGAGEVRWSTAAFTEDANANALRWGTLYNFWFDCDRAPVAGHAEIELFKPAAGCQPASARLAVNVPAADCSADIAHNGTVDVDDLLAVISGWGPCACSFNCTADIARN